MGKETLPRERPRGHGEMAMVPGASALGFGKISGLGKKNHWEGLRVAVVAERTAQEREAETRGSPHCAGLPECPARWWLVKSGESGPRRTVQPALSPPCDGDSAVQTGWGQDPQRQSRRECSAGRRCALPLPGPRRAWLAKR